MEKHIKRPINGYELIIDVRLTLMDLELTDIKREMTGRDFVNTKNQMLKKFNAIFENFNGSENSINIESKGFYHIQRRYNNFVIICNKLLGTEFEKIEHTIKRLKWEQKKAEEPADSMCYNHKFYDMINQMTRGKFFNGMVSERKSGVVI